MNSAINLMTRSARRREIYRTRLRQWLKITISLLLILVMVTAVHYYSVRQTNLAQKSLEASLEPINHLREANERLTKQIATIRDEEQFILALSSRNQTVTLLGLLGSAVANVGDQVFLESIEFSSSERNFNTQIESQIDVNVAGVANIDSAAGQVAAELQTSIPSGKVDVTSNKESRIKNQFIHNFTLHGTFQN